MPAAVAKQQKLFSEPPVKAEIVRVEKNLNTIGFFTPSSKKLTGISSKTVVIPIRTSTNQRVEGRATIFPSAEFGLPTTSDQDKFFAFQKLIERLRGPDGVVTNPVRFTSAAILEILGMTQGGKNYLDISEWLRRMTFTGIESEGVVFLAGKKKFARDMFHVFQRSVAVGDVLDDGTVAQENYVWLSDWQLENLNNRHTLPINYDVYRTLQLHIAKALVPLLQMWFYASREQYIEKRYGQLCSLLGIQSYRAVSRIQQQLRPSLDELKLQNFLTNWEIAETADGAGYKLRLWAGEAFVSGADLRLAAAPPQLLIEHENKIIEALEARGVREDRARKLLLDITDAGLAMDRIEWASAEIERKAKTRAPFDNPAGFIVYVLQTEHPVPASFLSSRRLALIRQAEQEAEQEAALRAQAELERYQWQERYEAFVAQTTDAYINEHIGPELLKKRLGAMRRKLAQNNAQARGWPEPVIEEYTLRLLREELARDLDLPSFDAYREIGADKLF